MANEEKVDNTRLRDLTTLASGVLLLYVWLLEAVPYLKWPFIIIGGYNTGVGLGRSISGFLSSG